MKSKYFFLYFLKYCIRHQAAILFSQNKAPSISHQPNEQDLYRRLSGAWDFFLFFSRTAQICKPTCRVSLLLLKKKLRCLGPWYLGGSANNKATPKKVGERDISSPDPRRAQVTPIRSTRDAAQFLFASRRVASRRRLSQVATSTTWTPGSDAAGKISPASGDSCELPWRLHPTFFRGKSGGRVWWRGWCQSCSRARAEGGWRTSDVKRAAVSGVPVARGNRNIRDSGVNGPDKNRPARVQAFATLPHEILCRL